MPIPTHLIVPNRRISDKFSQRDSRTIHFEPTVEAHGNKTITYTVKYTWRDPED